MAKPPVLYRETRLPPAPSSKPSICHINVAGTSNPPSPFGAGRKRPFNEVSVGLDEEQYARKHLATETSLFFRSQSRSPRSFLWRILNDRKLLEIQSVDLLGDKRYKLNGDGGGAIFHLEFKQPIARHGIQFADAADDDALEVFVLTVGNELITITLTRDLLGRPELPKDLDVSACTKKYTSGSLNHKTAYRFVALSSLELVISLHDGGLLHLERNARASGSQWRETFYNEGGWKGTIRGLIPFRAHQTVQYGNAELDPSAAAATAKSPDGRIWTIGLDATLRAWSTKTGQVVASMDVLNQTKPKDGPQRQSYIISAEQGTLLQIVQLPPAIGTKAVAETAENNDYCIVLLSPKDHQFKIYNVHRSPTPEGEVLQLSDLQPSTMLVPPVDKLMNTNIWHMEHFYFHPGPGWMGTHVWIRARSGGLCRTYTLTFDLLDQDDSTVDNAEIWQTGWSVVDTGSSTIEELKHRAGFPGDIEVSVDDAMTPTERWLQFLSYPGRFSGASLETALHLYRKGRNLQSTASRGFKGAEGPFEERLTDAITSKIMMHRLPDEQPDYLHYQQDIQAQWQTFFSLLSHLHSRRHESIGFAFDSTNALPYNVCADSFAPIRECSAVELCAGNVHLHADDAAALDKVLYDKIFPEFFDAQSYEDSDAHISIRISILMGAARAFRRSLSSISQDRLHTAAVQDALQFGSEQPQFRSLQDLYDMCGFEAEIADDDFDALNTAVEPLGGLGSMDDNLLLAVLEWLDEDHRPRGTDSGTLLSRYGVLFTIAVAQETLQDAQAFLLDLLALVVFMSAGLEADELHGDFQGEQIYEAILSRIKRNELLQWLASHEILERMPHQRGAKEMSAAGEAELRPITILEFIFINDWVSHVPAEHTAMPELLTNWSKYWIGGPDIKENWDGTTSHIMASLLGKKEIELATAFAKFMGEGDWARYLLGRLHLAAGDCSMANLDFQGAAQGLATAKIDARTDTAYLLSADEDQHFGQGLSSYFEHVATLFDKMKSPTYCADLLRLSLHHFDEDTAGASRSMVEIDRRKRNGDSEVMQIVDDSMEEVQLLKQQQRRDDILAQLFRALISTGQFEEALDTVKEIADPAARKASLKTLIEKCIQQDAVTTLLELKFEGDLAQDADKALSDMGQIKTATPLHQVLYAFRAGRADYRGAAAVMYEHLERLRHSKDARIRNPEDDTLMRAYLLLINTLVCCGEDDAWVLAEPIQGVHAAGTKRKLVRLDDVRREYGMELDRRSDLLQGRFPLVGGGDEMNVL